MNKIWMLRIAAASLAIIVVVSGVVGKLNYGGICSLGTGEVWGTCPLGYLERSLAARELLPWWPSAALVALSVIVLGRIFCAWICPSVLFRRLFGNGNGRSKPIRNAATNGSSGSSYSSFAILGGVLLASYLFGFPVFCLFCPIGLCFGAIYAGIKFFSLDSVGLELVLFPVLLGLELWGLKSWCRSICPLGALLSIFGNLNRFFVPSIRPEKCLTSKGVNCRACVQACPEGIDLAKIRSRFSINSCTKCLECYGKCPKGAVELPVLR